MKHWLAVPALLLGLCIALTALAGSALAQAPGHKKGGKRHARTKVFEVVQARLPPPHDPERRQRRRRLQVQAPRDEGDRRRAAGQVRRRRGRRRHRQAQGLRRPDDPGDEAQPPAHRPRGQERQGRTGRRPERDRGDQRRPPGDPQHVGPQLPVQRLLHPRIERRRPALRRLHDGKPAGLGQPLLRPLREELPRWPHGQLRRIPPGRLGLLRGRNPLRHAGTGRTTGSRRRRPNASASPSGRC